MLRNYNKTTFLFEELFLHKVQSKSEAKRCSVQLKNTITQQMLKIVDNTMFLKGHHKQWVQSGRPCQYFIFETSRRPIFKILISLNVKTVFLKAVSKNSYENFNSLKIKREKQSASSQ